MESLDLTFNVESTSDAAQLQVNFQEVLTPDEEKHFKENNLKPIRFSISVQDNERGKAFVSRFPKNSKHKLTALSGSISMG